MATTIQLEERVKNMLERLKTHPRETYNKVIQRLILSTEEGELSPKTLKNIERSLKDIKKGKTYSTAELKKKLKIK